MTLSTYPTFIENYVDYKSIYAIRFCDCHKGHNSHKSQNNNNSRNKHTSIKELLAMQDLKS